MNFDDIKNYWENRAAGDASAQSTTQDYYLREIEFDILHKKIEAFSPSSVADIGCGDGRTTMRIAEKLPLVNFYGFDYSSAMVDNARSILQSGLLKNIKFAIQDIREGMEDRFDAVYTTRCLINLPSWELQQRAIDNIHSSLNTDGMYFMIENFIEGQDNFNRIRREFGLSEIPVRDHNLFFVRSSLNNYIKHKFAITDEINISSTYYLTSRIIYSKICSQTGQQPDYFDDHHRFATGLPFAGEFGPVRLVCLKKL